MIGNDWTLMVARWFEHPEYGVNALLPAVLAARAMSPLGELTLKNDVEDKDCQKDYRPEGGVDYLVIGTERAERPVKSGNRKTADREDWVGLGCFYMSSVPLTRALRYADPVLEATLASLKLLCDKGLIDKIDGPDDGRDSWQTMGRVRVIELEEYDALRLRASGQQTGAVAVAALFARLKGLRTTFEPTGVA